MISNPDPGDPDPDHDLGIRAHVCLELPETRSIDAQLAHKCIESLSLPSSVVLQFLRKSGKAARIPSIPVAGCVSSIPF